MHNAYPKYNIRNTSHPILADKRYGDSDVLNNVCGLVLQQHEYERYVSHYSVHEFLPVCSWVARGFNLRLVR